VLVIFSMRVDEKHQKEKKKKKKETCLSPAQL